QPGADGRPIPASVATLDVSPTEAEKLVTAQTMGSIQLVLRGYGDPDTVNTKGVSTTDVAAALREYAPPANATQQRAPRNPVGPALRTPEQVQTPTPAPAPAPVVAKPAAEKP